MASVSFDAVTLATPDGRVLQTDLTLGFGDERTGIVGANGVGKTTLLGVLLGARAPAHGRVSRDARVVQLAQRSGVASGNVADALGVGEILAALARLDGGVGGDMELACIGDRWDVEAQAEAALERMGVAQLKLDRGLATLSGGERTRVALAALLVAPSDLMVLDEPTHHLDGEGRAAVHALCEVYRGGMVVVSHDRELLERMDRIVELSSLGARVYGGNYSAYRAARDAEAEAAAQRWTVASRELASVRRELQRDREKKAKRESMGRRLRVSGGVPQIKLGMMKETSEQSAGRTTRAGTRRLDEARTQAGEARQELERRQEITASVAEVSVPAARRVLWLDQLTVGRPPLFPPLSLALHGPERLAIVGPNGVGKSTLLRAIVGRVEPSGGQLKVGVEHVAWVDQDTVFLRAEATVWDNYRAHDPEGTTSALARFSLPYEMIHRRVDTLSGGERVRVALACVLGAQRPAELVLLDEPTHHLDLPSVEAVERALRGYHGALIVVSHDHSFLERLEVGRVVELRRADQSQPTRVDRTTRSSSHTSY